MLSANRLSSSTPLALVVYLNRLLSVHHLVLSFKWYLCLNITILPFSLELLKYCFTSNSKRHKKQQKYTRTTGRQSGGEKS